LPLAITAVAPGIFGGLQSADGLYMQVFGTGFGPETRGADGLDWLQLPVTATIGGVPAKVLYSGGSPGSPGLQQVNLQVPANAPRGPAVQLVLTIGGTSTPGASVALQ
jgi:uncharacterized protein (TIGR03437 family)